MKARIAIGATAIVVLVGLAVMFVGDVRADLGGPPTVIEAVKKADAVVIGAVTEVESRRWRVTLFKKGSNGTEPAGWEKWYDLANLHDLKVLKSGPHPTNIGSEKRPAK